MLGYFPIGAAKSRHNNGDSDMHTDPKPHGAKSGLQANERSRLLLRCLLDQLVTYTSECEWCTDDTELSPRGKFYRMKYRQQLLRIDQLARELGGQQ
jgi:hypothetical protein